MNQQYPERPLIAELFVCGPIAMLIWSETAVLDGRGPSVRELMG
ncbi:hypothetical protein AB0N05_17060 [Nocardia sp. NPDC051030]